MNDRRDEQSKRKAEYDREYHKRPEIKERKKEYMRLYRARKQKERLDAGDIAGTSVNNNESTLIQKKPTNIGMDSQNDHQYELHQTPTVSITQTPNINNEQITSNNPTIQEYIQKYSTWVGYERDMIYDRYWFSARRKFESLFDKIQFDVACDVCDRLWPDTSFRPVPAQGMGVLREEFPDEDVKSFKLCSNCEQKIRQGKIPLMSRSNGFKYPPAPKHLPELNPIETRLISPRLPFMQIRRLRHEGSKCIVGQVVNIPVDVDEMVTCLPRNMTDDQTINVNIKKHLIHKSNYLNGYVCKGNVKTWLKYLERQPLYRMYNIKTDFTELDTLSEEQDENIETTDLNTELDSDIIAARQHTFMWDEEKCLNIAPGMNKSPLNIIFDQYAEELSFPQIYFGVGRKFSTDTTPTPYNIATSEIRRKDRRGVTPEHILYMAMKIMRLRVSDGIKHTFKCIPENENITRADLQNKTFMKDKIEKNMSFLKSIPNSMQYWAERKRDLFAMIRQLGKPTAFLTISANEIKWPNLVKILHLLNTQFKIVATENLNRSMRSTLVNEDPVTCCIYFKKFVDVLMSLLKKKQKYNPFGQYRVIDYFIRIEFQHRGSPHAHILLWLNDDPKETVSEEMPLTLQLMTDLCSVDKDDLMVDDKDAYYSNNVHRHTFTCTKRGEKSCRFNIPHWPLPVSRVFIPMPKENPSREKMKRKAKEVRENLETKTYTNMSEFFRDNNLHLDTYSDVIRASIHRPTIVFKRDMTQIMTNQFNPFISSVLNSNMDLQIILDEYSCAAYVVEYVNKSNRGISHLHRELIKLQEDNPELTEHELMRKIALKMLNAVEMSAQEAAWYLLRQPMSYGSRFVFYIPTVWPHERQKSKKRFQQMEEEGLDDQSTDVWTKNPIQRYEERPKEMDDIYLAEFLAWYTPAARKRTFQNNNDDLDDDTNNDQDEKITSCKRREQCRVLRWRGYEIEDVVNYKREHVLLYIPFRNETVDILDRNKFMDLYAQNEGLIMRRKQEYTSNLNIEQLMKELREMCDFRETEKTDEVGDGLQQTHKIPDDNTDDIYELKGSNNISVVKKREGVMPKQQYNEMMRKLNHGQKKLIYEYIRKLRLHEAEPIQIALSGPAGSGKTFLIKMLMETCNRFSQSHNRLRNAYVACASTGKAAAAFNGTTVHSAFRISAMRNSSGSLTQELQQTYRGMFNDVNTLFIDEISMCSADILSKVDARLKQIKGVYDQNFAGMNVLLIGDLRQLPPVRATPVYKANKNMIGGPILWQSLHSHTLTEVMRQSDKQFSDILTKIGDGLRLSSEETRIIESRFTKREWCDENVKEAIRVFHDNRSVDEYNLRAIVNPELISIAKDSFTGYSNNTELTNARKELHKQTTTECEGYPYSIRLEIGYPYMITTNVDVEDGIVNGAIGTLMYIEKLTEDEIADEHENDTDSKKIKQTTRLWFKFPDERTGRRLRIKARPHVTCKYPTLQFDWTPIHESSVRIGLGRKNTIKCRRIHFPIVPACAITIHKSQGCSFDQVVYQYDKRQEQAMVYVALSRARSLQGLYMTNKDEDYTFYHGRGNDSTTTREIRDEYARQAKHPLPTITDEAEQFMDKEEESKDTIIIKTVAHNVQSLLAHKQDVECEHVMMKADYLCLNETWMDEDNLVDIKGYEVGNYYKNEKGRTAGGVAIYRSVDSLTTCEPIQKLPEIERLFRAESGTGDICLVGVNLHGRRICVLASVYIHPNTDIRQVQLLLYSSLAQYGTSIQNIIENFESELDVPIALMGDFNVDVNEDKNKVAEFLAREFKMRHHPNALPTTLGNTCIDHIFLRNMNNECMPYISYFSYHRPLLNRLSLM